VLVTLPVIPVSVLHDTSIVAANYDAGETVGWPAFVAEIGGAYRQIPARYRDSTAILASNYGEAGAVDRYGRALGLPHAYGVQDGYWYWGPPPASATSALAVGFTEAQLSRLCAAPSLLAVLDNHRQIHDDEQGARVWFCPQLDDPWAVSWPRLRVIG
jgi:hypothetical protein